MEIGLSLYSSKKNNNYKMLKFCNHAGGQKYCEAYRANRNDMIMIPNHPMQWANPWALPLALLIIIAMPILLAD